MKDNFTRMGFERLFNVEKLITIFYMEFSHTFQYDGEQHNFWEMVYIDKGEMVCTADSKRFLLKSGEMTFHKPMEFHNLSGNGQVPPNVSILTFECKSRAMKHFEGRIFRLNAEERALLSMVFAEGLSCFRLADERNPLLQQLERLPDAPFGSSQATKNLLEVFLIRMYRNTEVLTKSMRQMETIDGVETPRAVREILDYLRAHLYGRVTVSDVANALGKSESSVKQQFAKYFHTGIITYYNAMKIREARHLIREGRYNMTQIADVLCYDSPQYFAKSFKMHMHMTPTEYKRSILT